MPEGDAGQPYAFLIYRYILGCMTPRNKVPYFTKLDPELREALRRYKADIGVPEAEQIDRALRAWLEDRGVLKSARKRASTRKV